MVAKKRKQKSSIDDNNKSSNNESKKKRVMKGKKVLESPSPSPSLQSQKITIGFVEQEQANEDSGSSRFALEKHILQFLRLQNQTGTNISKGNRFHGALTLSFLNTSSPSSPSSSESVVETSSCQENTNDTDDRQLASCVSSLLSFLTNDMSKNVTSTKSNLSKTHVASLLLPWATSLLLRQAKGNLKSTSTSTSTSTTHNEQLLSTLWKTFALSFEFLSLGTAHEFQTNDNNDTALVTIINHMMKEEKDEEKTSTRDNYNTTTTATNTFKKTEKLIHNQNVLGSTLPLGTLNKLIQFAAISLTKGGFIQSATTRCYCLLVMASFYQPTMDHMCHSLLPMIDDTTSNNNNNNNNDDATNQCQALVSFCTLKKLEQLIQQHKRATNPKNSFILLASIQILTILCKFSKIIFKESDEIVSTTCTSSILASSSSSSSSLHTNKIGNEEVVKNILWHGLFDPDHHMEGFHNMRLDIPGTIDKPDSKKHDKKCYQQNLFESIDTMYRITIEKEEEKKSNDVYMDLIPLLFDGFVHQSNIFHENNMRKYSQKTNTTRVDKLAKIQFRFWCRIFDPLISLLGRIQLNKQFDNENCRNVSIELLHTITESILLLSKSESYLPSYADPNNDHLNYLIESGEILLASMEQNKKSIFSQRRILSCNAMKELFSLNHHIFHNKLPRIIFSMASSNSTFDQSEMDTYGSFLSHFCTTYQKLRQMTHFIECIVGCFDHQSLHKNTGFSDKNFNNDTINILLHSNYFVRSLFSAIYSLPQGQIQELWDIFHTYFQSISAARTLEKNDKRNFENVADFYVLFLKGVHVTVFNAREIMDSCELTMNQQLSQLIAKEEISIDTLDMNCIVSKSRLHLCGWLLNVHTKCSFWLNEIPINIGSSSEFGKVGVPLVPLLSRTVNKYLSDSTERKHDLGALQHLAWHRIEQLHSHIFLQQEQEVLHELCDNIKSKAMMQEAEQLVNFLIVSARDRKFTDDCVSQNVHHRVAGWKLVAQSLSTWSVYSNDDQINCFLEWLFDTLITPQEANSNILGGYVDTINERIPSKLFAEEYAVANALIHDASFYEVDKICNRVGPVMCTCLVQLINKILLDSSLISSFFHGSLTKDSFDQLLHFKEERFTTKDIFVSFQKVHSILYILREMSYQFLSQLDTDLICDTVLRSHILFQKIIKCLDRNTSLNSQQEVVIKISCISMDILAKVSIMGRENTKISYITSADSILYFCENIYHDCIHQRLQNEVILSTSKLFRGCFIFSTKQANNIHHDEFSMFDVISQSLLDYDIKIQLLRPMLWEVTNMIHRYDDKSDLSSRLSLVLTLIEENLKSVFSQQATLNESNTITIACVADVLNICSIKPGCVNPKFMSIMKKLYSLCLKLLSDTSVSKKGMLVSSCQYFVSIISMPSLQSEVSLDKVNTTKTLQTLITQYVTINEQVSPFIDAAYNEKVSIHNPSGVEGLLQELFSCIKSSSNNSISAPALMYCFDIMIRAVKAKESRLIIEPHARHIFKLGIEAIKSFKQKYVTENITGSQFKYNINVVLGCLTTLLQAGDLLVLNGSFVSCIFSTINSMLIVNETSCSPLDVSIYLSICKLVKLLLRQYTKHVYGCVSSFTSTLRYLFKYLVSFERKKIGDESLKQMVQELTKICECLPDHKDIFKKHLTFVVLDVVSSISSGQLNSWKKKALEPALFFILESLSKYENQQITSMVPTTEKPFLQSIFKNFEKHQYKGQF